MPKRRDTIPPKEINRLIQSTRRGHVIEFESLNDLAARADGRVAVLKRIFSKGVLIKVGDVTVRPEDAPILFLGMLSVRRQLDADKAKKMGGHNRVPDEDRLKALPFWQDETLTDEQLKKFTGYSKSSLARWFAEDYPRSPKRGRPKRK